MNDLVRKFSAVLTPPNHTPPNRIQGRGRPSVESMEMRTIPSTELQRRCWSHAPFFYITLLTIFMP